MLSFSRAQNNYYRLRYAKKHFGMLPEMRMVIDVKSRKEDESAANGPQWAARADSLLLVPFLCFLPRKLQHNSAGEHAPQ